MMIAQHLAFIFVPRAGIEPAWRLIHWCLRPARLPIPPALAEELTLKKRHDYGK